MRAALPPKAKILRVVRDGKYAIVAYEDEFGDGDLFEVKNGRWCDVGHGKGGPLPLAAWGVPPDVARRLFAKLNGVHG